MRPIPQQGKSQVFARVLSWIAPVEFLEMHWYQYTQKIKLVPTNLISYPSFVW